MNLDQMIKNGWWGESPFADRRMIVYPAHPSNYYTQRICTPIFLCVHEPQEPSDDRESTPAYFAQDLGANGPASTRYYLDSDGDVYQMVPENRPAVANGLDGRPAPIFGDGGPEIGGRSANDVSDNIEVEGMTATIHQTFSNAQFEGLVDWGVLKHIQYPDIRVNPKRWQPHGYLSVNRTDGIWIIERSGVVQEVMHRMTKIEKDIQDIRAALFGVAKANNERNDQQDGLIWGQQVQINALKEAGK